MEKEGVTHTSYLIMLPGIRGWATLTRGVGVRGGGLLVLLYFHFLIVVSVNGSKISNPVFGLGTYRPTEDVYRQMHHFSSHIFFSRH